MQIAADNWQTSLYPLVQKQTPATMYGLGHYQVRRPLPSGFSVALVWAATAGLVVAHGSTHAG